MKKTERSSAQRKRRNVAKAGGPRGAQPPGGRPQRTCVGCRTIRNKRDLVRVVRAPAGTLSVDPRGKAPGRGAYLDPDPACLERGLREGALSRALEVTIDEPTAERLKVEVTEASRTRQKETS